MANIFDTFNCKLFLGYIKAIDMVHWSVSYYNQHHKSPILNINIQQNFKKDVKFSWPSSYHYKNGKHQKNSFLIYCMVMYLQTLKKTLI